MTELRKAAEMALDALDALYINDYSGYEISKHEAHIIDDAMTALRQALAQSDEIKSAVLAEREACAKVCENVVSNEGYVQAKYCAVAIRARSKHD